MLILLKLSSSGSDKCVRFVTFTGSASKGKMNLRAQDHDTHEHAASGMVAIKQFA